MHGFSGSVNSGNTSWPLFAPFEVSVYILDYAVILHLRFFQLMYGSGDTRTVYDVGYGVIGDRGVGTSIGKWDIG